ncbi:hypothetical protein NG798_07060 [Ancylothrix sp. C2]|uniref:hypothetical protein n=1 Tax=Ancylothrix sp. D3o TaxID=2953691 RepID=UPI0021BBA25D|nr:hypothetical protein [Ancylothrix sp. D3o]MCT7949540.1 hypothetical protein [Ancylothrix sp. D3o]
MERTVNCAVECVNGCVLGEKCPNKEYAQSASQFINDTSLDKILEMAEAARIKKLTAPPQWIIPDFDE